MKSFILILILSLVMRGFSANDPQHCFDVLEITQKSEIKKFSEMSFIETANTVLTADIFSCFLEESRNSKGEKSETEKHYDIYKKCNEFEQNNNQPIGSRQFNELTKLGLSQALDNYIKNRIKSKEMKNREGILYIAEEMEKSIEKSLEFKNYKKFILQQLEGPKIKHISNDERSGESNRNSGQKSYYMDISYILLFQYICLLSILMFL
ncbi:uncharacterized protein LOC119599886 [Lucilia sericata]|uniref:uncharacterized protein LOC119599886 n=1 Tax=Lucilia sericata TaxID=13632 RepID=UPI0018A82FC3|nr:uncharacterized protein LOC119599886 [Lucilia sericata]